MTYQRNKVKPGFISFVRIVGRLILLDFLISVEHQTLGFVVKSHRISRNVPRLKVPIVLKDQKRPTFIENAEPDRKSYMNFDSTNMTGWASSTDSQIPDPQQQEYRPLPQMPSELFLTLARSQLELLAHSIDRKIKSLALYLPQENAKTGQLEFLPVVIYPDPTTERVFIASEADSGVAPKLPKMLTKLPGFAHATTLLPGYPMVSTSSDGGSASAGAGVVEEVFCDMQSDNRATSLSVPLFSGSQTVGAMLVSPHANIECIGDSVWVEEDKMQIARAAQSLSLALSMDVERRDMQAQVDQVRDAMSDSLHQIKNPLQALRTFGKLLQRRIAGSDESYIESGTTPQLLALAQHLMVQSERVEDLLLPMDHLVSSLDSHPIPLYLCPSTPPPEETAIAPWQERPDTMPWEADTIEFARDSAIREDTSSFFIRNPPMSPNRGSNTTIAASKAQGGGPETTNKSTDDTTTPSSKHASSPPTMLGDVDLEMSFVPDVLDPILSAFQAIASERNIAFDVEGVDDELPGVLACPKSLQEAVSNLLDNALKYVTLRKEGSTTVKNEFPRVRLRLIPNEKPYAAGVTILVDDNGPGIPPEDRTSIFQRGFRSKLTSSVNGSGIGLDISIGLLSRMGGILQVGEGDANSLDGAVMKCILFRDPEL